MDFSDRRNPEAILNVYGRYADPVRAAEVDVTEVNLRYPLPSVSGPWSLRVGSFRIPEPEVTGYEYERADQPVLIEIWVGIARRTISSNRCA